MWLLSLFFLTSFFILSGFFIDQRFVLAYRWMTMGMAIVSFIYYFIIRKYKKRDNKKIVGANIAAVIVKFSLSALVIILYGFIFGLHNNAEFIFFFMAYFVYSIVTYFGAYRYK